MKKIRLFLASSNELKAEREKFEIEIYRKCKLWFDKGVFLSLDIWEDLPAKMSPTRSQDEYNTVINGTDLFILLAFSKVGMYTAEEFETAFGSFRSTQKPFIYTYFRDIGSGADPSLKAFKDKLAGMGHFYSTYKDFNDLWTQFNKELDRMLVSGFKEFLFEPKQESREITLGNKSQYIENADVINITNH